MSTNFTNTLSVSICHTLCVDVKTHAPVVVDVTLPYAVDVDSATKPVRKILSERSDVAFAMVTGVECNDVLCTLPIDVFTEYAEKMSRRGENGRTREPVMTRTLERSVCHALCVDVKTHAPVVVDVTLPYAVDVDSATKPVRKILSERSDVAFAMVTGVDTDNAVYEMPVKRFLALCKLHGKIEAKLDA